MTDLTAIKERLSGAQIFALRCIDKYGARTHIKFNVGEALRKRGLVTRYTTYSIRAVYASSHGEHEQYVKSPEAPVVFHEWKITKAGHAALLTALAQTEKAGE